MTLQEWVNWLKKKKRKHDAYTREKANLYNLHISNLNAIASEECQQNKKTAEYYGKLIKKEKESYYNQEAILKKRFKK